MQIVLAPTPSLKVGVTTPWCLLAAVSHLDIEIDWRQTPETLEVRRRVRPGAKPVRWGAGILNVGDNVGDASSGFGPDGNGDEATLPLVKAGIREGEAHVDISITASGAAISTQITVK